jgi:hypothetical protein
MSLAESVLDIAQEMTLEADRHVQEHNDVEAVLRGFVVQLRLVVKAADQPITNVCQPPEVREQVLINKAREEFRRQKQEAIEMGNLLEIADGPLQGDWLPVPPQIIPGMKTSLNGFVYQLRGDHKLWLYQEAQKD